MAALEAFAATAPPGGAAEGPTAPKGAVAEVGADGRATGLTVRKFCAVQAEMPKVGKPVGVGPRPPRRPPAAPAKEAEWRVAPLDGRVRPGGRANSLQTSGGLGLPKGVDRPRAGPRARPPLPQVAAVAQAVLLVAAQLDDGPIREEGGAVCATGEPRAAAPTAGRAPVAAEAARPRAAGVLPLWGAAVGARRVGVGGRGGRARGAAAGDAGEEGPPGGGAVAAWAPRGGGVAKTVKRPLGRKKAVVPPHTRAGVRRVAGGVRPLSIKNRQIRAVRATDPVGRAERAAA